VVTVAVFALGAVLFVLGMRLLWLAWRTRQLPELLVGLFFAIIGPFGALRVAVERWDDDRALSLAALGELGVMSAMILVCLFTYRTFRRGVLWARVATLLVIFALTISYGIEVGGNAMLADFEPRLIVTLPRAACLGWSTYESLRCYRMMRRRISFGLADPVVANRFLLYALWTLSLATLPVLRTVTSGLELAHVQLPWRTPLQTLAIGAGLVMFAAMFLNFWPPRAYVRWIQRGHRDAAT
jgi:hypothetical protein